MKYKVIFYPDNIQIKVEEGENLLRAAMIAGVCLNASCGGDGTCGKCRVIIEKGIVEQQSTGRLTTKEIEQGYVLACLSKVGSDLEVRIPSESRLGKFIERKAPSASHMLIARGWEEYLSSWKMSPPVQKFYIEMSPPSLDDNTDDLRRIKRTLSKTHGLKEEVDIDLSILKYMVRILREANWRVTVTLVEFDSHTKIIKIEAGDTTGKNYAVAVDIGTTTIGARLINLSKQVAGAQGSKYNAQASCGADVISRMIFSCKKDGLVKLQSLVVDTISELIAELVSKAGIEFSDISCLILAGNTIMTHLFFGLSPKYIREAPYIPTATNFPWIKAKDFGMNIFEEVYAYCFPCVASYVGGDVVAGVIASGMSRSNKLTLFIDVGTNGEIVLGNADWLLACSCSAGPAFEGGGVKHGMRAIKGAIEQIRIDRNTYEPMILTIGQTKPVGICGSGLIDALAEMFLSKIVDQRGKINVNIDCPRVREGEHRPEYVLVWANETANGKDIVVTEVDIDNLIRAKAAIFAGISVLLESANVNASDIEEIFIAGAFGNYLEIERVQVIGLLPECPFEKVKFVGNGSLAGASLGSLSKEILLEAKEVAEKMAYVELSADAKFMDKYISALFLPHTNIELFPTVMKELKNK
ncbi:ASKHA domain-containing protein [Candidatus Oleimmundimicrobium sp.]|uniref:ASKHA domain-containing protein n=1 Tax=Candidatus Oleimmundimicrobium sp. TaxID=3060597 RepID=UPI002716D091|nr:ASKHA domain-containing protein [Candidatus Oleimmundimicrobium sp.]MDO8886251.1 ASKHA domain-containing protein [Candidatus Oleimmundimicrobium sp.]